MTLLRTATGKLYCCDFMGVANNAILYVTVDMDAEEVLQIFRNPEETSRLEWLNDSEEVVRSESGFTEFEGLTIMGGRCPIRVRMARKWVSG